MLLYCHDVMNQHIALIRIVNDTQYIIDLFDSSSDIVHSVA